MAQGILSGMFGGAMPNLKKQFKFKQDYNGHTYVPSGQGRPVMPIHIKAGEQFTGIFINRGLVELKHPTKGGFRVPYDTTLLETVKKPVVYYGAMHNNPISRKDICAEQTGYDKVLIAPLGSVIENGEELYREFKKCMAKGTTEEQAEQQTKYKERMERKQVCAEKTGWDRMKVIYPKCATSPCPSIDNNPKAITKAYKDCLKGIEANIETEANELAKTSAKTKTLGLSQAKDFFNKRNNTILIIAAVIILAVIYKKPLLKMVKK